MQRRGFSARGDLPEVQGNGNPPREGVQEVQGNREDLDRCRERSLTG